MPEENRQAIESLILESRRNLLDLSLRNRLVNHRVTKTRDIEIVGEDPVEIYRILVTEQKAMVFDGVELRGDDNGDSEDEDYIPPDVDTTDNRLQTAIPATRLQMRLLKMSLDARTAIEEQGANLLNLALGMVDWIETPGSTELRHAPLLLLPVSLERSGSDRFSVKYSGEEIGTNLSFQAKLKSEYGVDIAELAEADEIDVAGYFDAVAASIAGNPGWRVIRDRVVLGFFTFARFLMYRDLDPIIWPARSGPVDNDVMNALVTRFTDREGALSEDSYLDDIRPPSEVHEVVDADSSQILALEDAKAKRNLVIEGPPGTGKSQTITNLIAEAVAAGRKVLFVAEKMAALEVVKSNLDRAELGDACLELHSHKANKRQVLHELERTLNLESPRDGNAELSLRQLGSMRERITAYVRALHEQIGGSGVTPFYAMGRLLQLDASSYIEPRSDFTEVATRDLRSMEALIDLAERLQLRLADGGPPRRNPYRGCRPASLLPVDRPLLEREIQQALGAAEDLRMRARGLASALRQPEPDHVAQIDSMSSLAIGLSVCPEMADRVVLGADSWLAREAELNGIIAKGEEFQAIHQTNDKAIQEGAWAADVAALLSTLRSYEHRWWRIFSGRYRDARNVARRLMRAPEAATLTTLISSLDAIARAQCLGNELLATAPICATLLGEIWQGVHTDWKVVRATTAWALSIHRDVSTGFAPREVLGLKFTPDFSASLGVLADAVIGALGVYRSRWEALRKRLVPGPELFPLGWDASTMNAHHEVLIAWGEAPGNLWNYVSFCSARDEAAAAGLASLCLIADEWDESQRELPWILEVTWLEGLLRQAYRDRPVLAAFRRHEHQQLISRFAEVDREVLRCNRVRVASAHYRSLPPRGGAGAMGLLMEQFARQRRHLPIRRLMERCWGPIQAIKPVFMMSPMSVAMFLPPNGPRFDLVIFDEASQIRPEDAFGAILRGAQAIVVGDSKQLPPTWFFTRLADGEEGDEESEAASVRDMESILGLFRARNAPYRQLRWHYRSRHHSLIAVSNHEFYDDRLIVFPCAVDVDQDKALGLCFRHLPHTVYGRGGTRSNIEEAQAVAEAVAEHARTNSDVSLGVAAFSQSQQDAIQVQLERMRSDHPELREFEVLHPHEPFFVKNLENVQGDERDIIFISIGYGRDSDGYLSHYFGPLNHDGGERRLNVLISRARQKCVVFSNFTYEDIDLHRSRSRGIQALKTFLKYAQTRDLDTPRPRVGDPASPLEEAVRDALSGRGHHIDCQVGSAGFFIDLAVVDPDCPGRYLLGIECDGAKYHSARSARDRDRLREQVLLDKGWRIHRIWGPDWYADSAACLAHVEEAIAAARVTEKRQANLDERTTLLQVEGATVPSPAVVREEVTRLEESATTVAPYQFANLLITDLSEPLHVVSQARLQAWAQQVVEEEGPIHLEEIVRRIREAAGVGRSGSRIQAAIGQALEVLCRYSQLRREGQFFWASSMGRVEVRSRENFAPPYKRIELIAPQEVDAAILLATGKALGITEDDLVTEVLHMLGFGRVTTDMQNVVCARVLSLLQDDRLMWQGSLLFPVPTDDSSAP